LLVFALILSGLAVMPSGAGASDSSGFVTKRFGNPGATRRAWTPERMRAARPAPMPTITAADLAGDRPASGSPLLIGGSAGSEGYSSTSGSSESWATRRPIPFTRTEVEDPSLPEYAAHGVIFGTSSMGDFACSGTAITSDNKSVVWTAGHCLHYLGEMSREVVFVPGYEKETFGETDAMEQTAPYGVWPAAELKVPTQWQTKENPLYDFGALSTSLNETGAALGDVIPTRGIAFNQHPTEALQSFGYPGMPSTKFDGEHLQTCVSQGSGRIWDGMVAMGCDMQQGSSGGGWVMRNEFVMSNVSGGNMRVWPNMAFGPYLGNAAKALYDAIRGGSAVYPQPTPSTPVTVPPKVHRMKITLNLRDHLTASGRITAPDGFSACAHLAPVRLGKKRDGVYYPVGKLLFTNAEGRFKTQLRDAKGSYLAIVEESAFDLSNRCDQAVTFDTHRH
jgi:V8-like Glu-specific endopeptidase